MTAPQMTEPACPKCGGSMWDNRLTKRTSRAPDFKCRDRACDGVIWPPRPAREPQDTPATAAAKAALALGGEWDEVPYGARLNSPGETVGGPPPRPAPVRPAQAPAAAAAAAPLPSVAARRAALTPEQMAERAARIENAMVRATRFVVNTVLPELDKAATDGPVVVTVDAAYLVGALMASYGKGGLL